MTRLEVDVEFIPKIKFVACNLKGLTLDRNTKAFPSHVTNINPSSFFVLKSWRLVRWSNTTCLHPNFLGISTV